MLKKTLITVSTVALLTIGGLALPQNIGHAEPTSVDEVKEERQQLKSQLNKKEKEIVKVLEEIEPLHKEIVELESTIKHNDKEINKINKKIKKHKKEIKSLQKDIDVINKRIDERAEILKTRLSSYQENGNLSFLDVVLGSKGFMDFISRIEAVTTITNADTELIEQQEADRAEVEKLQDDVQAKIDEEEEAKIDIKEIQKITKEQKKKVEKSKKSLDKKKDKLNKEKSKLTSKDRSLADLEASFAPSYSNNSGSNNTSSASSNNESTVVNNSTPPGGVVSAAMSRVGKNNTYVWAGKTPSQGFDCSGFVSWAYGGSISSSTAALQNEGQKIPLSQAKPGDLIFFDTVPGRSNSHVGIYLGGKQFVGSQSSTGVAVASFASGYWADAFKGHVRRVN